MPWDVENLNPVKRFFLDEKREEWVDLRIASDEDNRSFFKQIGVKEKAEYKTDPKTRAMQRVSFVELTDDQRERFNDLVWDFSIVDWCLLSNDGSAISCTKDMKIKMMRFSPMFAQWISDCLDDLRESIKVYKVVVEKN